MTQNLTQLVTRVTERLSMVSGRSVQLYAEDRIVEMIQHKFDILFDLVFWSQFCSWRTSTLDGTTGVVTENLTTILKRFKDIQVIYRYGTDIALNEFPQSVLNPDTVKGSTPKFFEPVSNTEKVFRIIPVTATGQITYRIRTKPDPFTEEDEINFDDQALILGATYDYLEDSGTNPQATEKFRLLFESRVTQLKSNRSTNRVALDPHQEHYETTSWTTLP